VIIINIVEDSLLLRPCKVNIRCLKSKNYLKFNDSHRHAFRYSQNSTKIHDRIGYALEDITSHDMRSQKDIIMSRIKSRLRLLGVAISPRVSAERTELNWVSSLQYRHNFRAESCGHPRDCGRYPGPRGSVDCPNSRDSANNGDRATRGVNSVLNYTGEGISSVADIPKNFRLTAKWAKC
jgi:hypothetical protein